MVSSITQNGSFLTMSAMNMKGVYRVSVAVNNFSLFCSNCLSLFNTVNFHFFILNIPFTSTVSKCAIVCLRLMFAIPAVTYMYGI